MKPEDTALYDLLQVSPDATPTEIKRAFHQLALKQHPDKGGDAETFAKLNNAYEILSDPDLRARYDSGQSDPSADPDFAEFFAQFSFSQTQPPRSHQTPRKTAKGPTQTIKLDIALEDLFKGREIKLNLSKQKVCGLCKGSGAKPGAQRKECIVCSGMGQTRTQVPHGPNHVRYHYTDCARCEGTGSAIRSSDICSSCRGTRTYSTNTKKTISVGKGNFAGQPIVCEGEGDETPDSHAAGDLIFLLEVRPHPTFSLVPSSRFDLQTQTTLTLSEMLLGFDRVIVNHLDGSSVRCKVDGPIEPHQTTKLHLLGQGLYADEREASRGDLYVDLVLDEDVSSWVRGLSLEQKGALEKMLPAKRPNIASGPVQVCKASIVQPGKAKAWFEEEGEEEDRAESGCQQS